MRIHHYARVVLTTLTVMLWGFTSVVYAPPVAGATEDRDFTGQARITDEAGHSYPVLVDRHTDKTVTPDGVDHHVVTTHYRSLPQGTTPATRAVAAANSAGGCEQDGSYSIDMCLTQFYDGYSFGNHHYVAVQRYTARWLALDRQFRINSADILAAVFGSCDKNSKCGFLNDRQKMQISNVSSRKTYTFVPRWAGKYVEVGRALYQCANSTVKGSRGRRHFTFVHANVCQGSLPGDGSER